MFQFNNYNDSTVRDKMHVYRYLAIALLMVFTSRSSRRADPDAYFDEGELAGSLRVDRAIAIDEDDNEHLWNRLFAAF